MADTAQHYDGRNGEHGSRKSVLADLLSNVVFKGVIAGSFVLLVFGGMIMQPVFGVPYSTELKSLFTIIGAVIGFGFGLRQARRQ